ncbi:L,D-transpeptidase family protein [Sphingomonas aerophila]|jgi:lipoprotein-anchoring transpeptidase ErfK/SrfK|uniref:Lipoprotein-anchoring transpeptidase ErfK/SrfK n=1 Tax=Sphingomonas aerophila TaxID=1344948 RepID=A0A7W9BDR6_9SPHN|nr:L,D-transpeptidase family protein [Sphingomonas aerophila]MBB5715261.1 lipoprotein-anchoring transpeptidase ErfK/SrfK [Sphingomonas aerophila]
MRGFVITGALLLGVWTTGPAQAASEGALSAEAAATLTPNAYVWRDDANTGNVRIVVSIADQRAYVYRDSTLIAVSSVSTGKEGKDTPVGVYPILQKNKDHKSNLYNAAPMPYMQRLTWDGIAIHAGKNPGFPASHGCIRVPTAFAQRLFDITAVGTTVEVTDLPVADTAPDDSLVPPDVMAQAEAAKASNTQMASLNR